jgi:VWFA-related protein
MLGTNRFGILLNLGKALSVLLCAALVSAESPGRGGSHRQVRIPTRPAALYTGQQGKQGTEIHFDPTTSTVTMKLLVQDPAGYFIPGLHRDNFAVYENGVRQHNATVEIEHAPVTLGIVMEHGGHYKGFNKISSAEVVRVGQQLLDEVGREDKIAIWQYADHLQQLADFSTPHDRLDQLFISSEVPDSSETNLYDALISTSEIMKPLTGRKALIVITSSVDTFSKANYVDALNAVRASATPVYIINLGPDLREVAKSYTNADPYRHLDWKNLESRLREIAYTSGGRMYTESSGTDLRAIYDDLMENLRVRYVISYRAGTSGPLGSRRRVRVELVDPKSSGRLEIVDADGKTIWSKVIVEDGYVPNAAST